MKVIDPADMTLADLRITALAHAVEVCGAQNNSNYSPEQHRANILETARLFYLFLCDEDLMLLRELSPKPKHGKDKHEH